MQIYGGSLTASSIDHDIAISAIGALSINQVKVNSAGATPQGSVFLSATGDINSASAYNVANPVVIGKNIEINSTSGAIGATSAVVNGASTLTNINPLVIQATGTIQANGTVDGGVLDSASATGTYIIQSKGDLRLGTIQSTGGPVFLEAAGSDDNPANILNGRAAVGLTQAQSQHLQRRLDEPRPAQRQRRHQRRQQLPVDGDVGLQRLLPAPEHRVPDRQHLQPDLGRPDGAAGAGGRQARHRIRPMSRRRRCRSRPRRGS